MHSFEVHSNESTCRKKVRHGLEQVLTTLISSMLTHCKLRNLSSDDITGFCRTRLAFLTDSVLKVLTMGGRYFDFLKKRQGKKVSWRSFSTPKSVYRIFCHTLQKDPLWLECLGHHGVTFLRTFHQCFVGRANVLFPHHCAIQQPIPFVILIPNKTTKVTHASAEIKLMM